MGWGETPLNVQWVWPSAIPYGERLRALLGLTEAIACACRKRRSRGIRWRSASASSAGACRSCWLRPTVAGRRTPRSPGSPPWVCASAFDLATHDAYGKLMDRPTYDTYGPEYLGSDLGTLLEDPAFAPGPLPL